MGREERDEEGPGLDAEKSFTKAFTKSGGTVVDGVRAPMENPEFAPFLQRARDAKPDAVFAFVPAGDQGIAFMKAYSQRGLAQAGIKLISTGDVTEPAISVVLSPAGEMALAEGGVFAGVPISKRVRAAVQEIFNRWA